MSQPDVQQRQGDRALSPPVTNGLALGGDSILRGASPLSPLSPLILLCRSWSRRYIPCISGKGWRNHSFYGDMVTVNFCVFAE